MCRVKLPLLLRIKLPYHVTLFTEVRPLAELLVRAGAPDRGVLERLAARASGPGLDRLVIDAHTPVRHGDLGGLLRARGIPLLIDPQTYFLQDRQRPADPWASLPFATPDVLAPADLHYPARVDELVHLCLSYQIDSGATQLVVPYVHIDRGAEEWAEAQALIYRRARRCLDVEFVGFRVIAPVAVSWRLLTHARQPDVLNVLRRGLRELAPHEIALAASKVDDGVRPWDRVSDLVTAIRDLIAVAPVIAWQQGALGELAVAAGAFGYECGIGWRERCNLRGAAASHRSPAGPVPIGARPTYIHRLMRSLPRVTLEVAAQHPAIAADLTCLNGDCCPEGRTGLTRDACEHSVLARARGLQALAAIDSPRWRWRDLEERAFSGQILARRLNLLADRTDRAKHVDDRALEAIRLVAHAQQRLAPRRVA